MCAEGTLKSHHDGFLSFAKRRLSGGDFYIRKKFRARAQKTRIKSLKFGVKIDLAPRLCHGMNCNKLFLFAGRRSSIAFLIVQLHREKLKTCKRLVMQHFKNHFWRRCEKNQLFCSKCKAPITKLWILIDRSIRRANSSHFVAEVLAEFALSWLKKSNRFGIFGVPEVYRIFACVLELTEMRNCVAFLKKACLIYPPHQILFGRYDFATLFLILKKKGRK